MAKTKSTLLNMVVVLTAFTVITGAALGFTYKVTKEPIAQAEKASREAAIKKVTPEFNNSPIEDCYEYVLNEGTKDQLTMTVYPAKWDGEQKGIAVETLTKNGFGGEVKMMVGFDNEGNILNYQVLSHAETPGLGSKMQEWFSNTDKPGQCIIGRNAGQTNLTVSKDGGDIDAITAATISSRAFLEMVRSAYAVLTQCCDATTGATSCNKTNTNE